MYVCVIYENCYVYLCSCPVNVILCTNITLEWSRLFTYRKFTVFHYSLGGLIMLNMKRELLCEQETLIRLKKAISETVTVKS